MVPTNPTGSWTISKFGRPLSVLIIFWSLKGGTKVAALCKGGFKGVYCETVNLCKLIPEARLDKCDKESGWFSGTTEQMPQRSV